MDKKNQVSIKKLVKYQSKLAVSGNNTTDANIYKQKIKQYVAELQKGGMNAAKINATIQNGGNPLEDLEAHRARINQAINGLKVDGVDSDKLKGDLDNITQGIAKAKNAYDDLGTAYGTYLTKNTRVMNETQRKLANTKLSGSLPDGLTDAAQQAVSSFKLQDFDDGNILAGFSAGTFGRDLIAKDAVKDVAEINDLADEYVEQMRDYRADAARYLSIVKQASNNDQAYDVFARRVQASAQGSAQASAQVPAQGPVKASKKASQASAQSP
jgi:hypothetical protein